MGNQRNLDLDIKLLRWIYEPGKKLHVRRIKDGDWESADFLLGNNKRWKTHEIDAKPVPAFTETLDLCFHYLIPKLDYIELHGGRNYATTTVEIKLSGNSYFAEHSSPSMALCLTIEQLIKSEVKQN